MPPEILTLPLGEDWHFGVFLKIFCTDEPANKISPQLAYSSNYLNFHGALRFVDAGTGLLGLCLVLRSPVSRLGHATAVVEDLALGNVDFLLRVRLN